MILIRIPDLNRFNYFNSFHVARRITVNFINFFNFFDSVNPLLSHSEDGFLQKLFSSLVLSDDLLLDLVEESLFGTFTEVELFSKLLDKIMWLI